MALHDEILRDVTGRERRFVVENPQAKIVVPT